jgi:photosystem II stability/assembly factor-like uncharacterized protein
MRPHLFFVFLAFFALCSNSYSQVTWEKVNFPTSPGGVHTLSLDPAGHIYASGDSGTYRSMDQGVSWNRIFPDQTIAGDFVFTSTGTIYALTLGFGPYPTSRVVESTDNGQTWIDQGLPSQRGIALAVDNHDRLLAATYDAGIYRSNKPGTWDHILLDKPPFDCITVDPQGRIFAGTWDRGILRSTDDGGTWATIKSGFPTDWPTITVEDVLVHFNGQLYAAADSFDIIDGGRATGGIFRSTDLGDTWVDMTGNLTNASFDGITVSPTGDLFTSVYGNGMYRSSDNGESWVGIGSPPTNSFGTPIADPDGILYVGSDIGLYRTTRTTGVNESHGEIPTTFALRQNYPNPFNPSTTITFELPKASPVTLSVYDLLGREVTVLVNERRNAGVHEVKFDASGLASGVYFYRMQAGSYVDTKKLLLVR